MARPPRTPQLNQPPVEYGHPELVGNAPNTQPTLVDVPETPDPFFTPPPTWFETMRSSFRHDNIVGAAIANQLDSDTGPVDPNFDLWSFVRGTPQEEHINRYIRHQAWNRPRAEQIRRQIEMETEDQRVNDANPWYVSIPMGILNGGILDPTVMMPGGALVRSGTRAYNILRSARSVGIAGATATALQEGVLQNLQLTRSAEESAMNIGGGAVLGVLLGGALGSLSRSAVHAAGNVLDNATPARPHTEIPASPGATTALPGVEAPRAPLPQTPGHEARGEISGFQGYDFHLRATNDPINPDMPTATTLRGEPRVSGSPEGTLDISTMHPMDRPGVRLQDEHGFIYRDDAKPNTMARRTLRDTPDWYLEVKNTVNEYARRLGLDEVNTYFGDLGPRFYGYHNAISGQPGFIAVHHGLSRESAMATALHELGHYITKARLDHIPPELRTAIDADHAAWVARHSQNSNIEELRPFSARKVEERFPDQSYTGQQTPGTTYHDYLLSKNEWLADQVSHWFLTNAQPRTVLERFFSSIADMWRKLFDDVGKDVAPSIDRFMRGQWDTHVQPLEASGTAIGHSRETPGFTAMMRAENENGLVHAEAANVEGNVSTTPAELGASSITALPREALSIKGIMAKILAAPVAWMIPNLRGNFRYTAAARQYYQQLMESVAIQAGHGEGFVAARGGSADRHAKTMFSAYTTSVRDSQAIYREMVKEHKMSWEHFGEAIGWANSNKDVALNQNNKYVTQAAELWRNQFFTPLFEEGKRLGLWSEHAGISTAESYFPRHPVKDAFVTNEEIWHQRNVPYWENRVTEAHNSALDKMNRRTDALDQQISDLSMTRDERSNLAQRLGEEVETVRARYGEFHDIDTQVRELRRQIRDGGDRAALSAQITALRGTEGYKAFESYLSQSGGRIRRLLSVDPADKINTLHDRLLLEEDRVHAQVNKLVEDGRRMERRLSSLDSEEHRAAVTELQAKIEDFTRQGEARQSKFRDDILKAEAEWSRGKAELVQRWKEKEQQLGSPDTRTAAVKQRDQLRQKIDAEAKRMEEAKFAYQEQQLKRLRRDSERGSKEQAKFELMNERLRKLEDLDPEQAQASIRQTMDELQNNAGERLINRGQRIQRLIDQMNDLDPKFVENEIARLSQTKRQMEDQFHERWSSGENVGTRTPNFRNLAQEISKEAYEKYRGTAFGNDSSARPDYIWTIERGPMRDRTYNVPDFILDPPGDPVQFFNRNIFEVANIHGRQVAGDIGISRVFNEPTMRDVLGQVATSSEPAVRGKLRDSYIAMEGEVGRATSIEEIHRIVGTSPTLKERAQQVLGKGSIEEVRDRVLRELEKDYKDSRSDLITMRDTIRGLNQVAENNSSFGRIVRATGQLNYVRVMGGQGLSMLTDLYRPAMVRGLNAYMADGLEQLMGNMVGFRASQKELQQMHLVSSNFMNRTLLTFADIGDPMLRGSPLERFLEKVTQVGSVWNGSRMIQDFAEGIGGTVTQTHILRIARDGQAAKHTEYLAGLGLDTGLIDRIGRHFAEHGETFKHGRGEVLVAHAENWTRPFKQADGTTVHLPDHDAINAYRNAVAKEVDTMFSSRMAGDVPFFMQTPMGKMLLQFNSFNVQSYSRVMLRGVQGEPMRFLGAIIPMTGLGMMVAYIQAAAGGGERFERFQRNVSANPMFWISEGLDKSGIFALPFMASNYVESAAAAGGFGRVNPIKNSLMTMGGSIPPDLQTSNSQRDIVSSIGGPTVGMVSSIPRAVGGLGAAARGDQMTNQQQQALIQNIPANTYPIFRQMLQWIVGDLPRWH